MAVTDIFARRATLSRSVRLLTEFRYEQPDPARFYGTLAADPALSRPTDTFVRASGMALPFADDSVDICLSSNVAEHLPRPWQLGSEMLRVTKPGGLVAVSAAEGLSWAESTGALVAAFPRYHPRWAWWLTSVPVLREFAVSNLVLVFQPRE